MTISLPSEPLAPISVLSVLGQARFELHHDDECEHEVPNHLARPGITLYIGVHMYSDTGSGYDVVQYEVRATAECSPPRPSTLPPQSLLALSLFSIISPLFFLLILLPLLPRPFDTLLTLPHSHRGTAVSAVGRPRRSAFQCAGRAKEAP